MKFTPSFPINSIVEHRDIIDEFKCGNMGGMRRSKKTNTLVIISDDTKGLYEDKWLGDILHYTGMGKIGDQDIHYAQNRTLAQSNYNNIDVHLFEVLEPREYTYRGEVELCGKP
jgi:5-methylcytosine-specific restriction protein A